MTCKPPVAFADAHDVGALFPNLRDIVHTLILRAPTHRLVLVSGTRTPYQQWMLRHERCPGHECGPMSQYPGHPRTALPGTSHHENTGPNHCAADLGGADLGWVHTVADEYGIHFPVSGENWHIEPVPGRLPITSIIPYGPPIVQPGKPPAKWVGFGKGDTDASVKQRGGVDHEVTALQLLLTANSRRNHDPKLDPHGADGIYGHDSQVAVNNFKKKVQAMQRAHNQPVWPNADSYVGQATWDMLRFLTP